MAGPTDREAKDGIEPTRMRKNIPQDFKIAIWNDDELAPVSTEISRRCTEIEKNYLLWVRQSLHSKTTARHSQG